MRCPITLNKDFSESLIALTTLMQTQEKISLPFEGTFTGNLSIQFNNGNVTLSTKSLCVSKNLHVTERIYNNNELRRSLVEDHQQLIKEFGSNRFLRRDAAKII